MINLAILSVLFSICALNRPLIYLISIIIITILDSSFLNIIGYSVISAAVGISAIFGYFYYLFKENANNFTTFIFLGCTIFYSYGVIRAFGQSPFVIDIVFSSGHFLSIFIIPYLFISRKKIQSQHLVDLVLAASIFIAFFSVLSILGFNLLNFPIRSSLVGSFGVQVPFVTLLGLGFVVLLNDENIKYRSGLILLLALAIFMQGHSSVTIAVIVTLIAKYLHLLNLYRLFSKAFFNFVAFSFFFLLMINITEIHNFLSLYFDEFQARDNQNLFRLNALEKNDFGMGFVPSNTDVQQRILSYSLSAFDRTLFTVDGGYINLGLLFGPYISALYLFLIHYIISNEINSNTQKDFLIIYLLALFGVNFTLSVHSYMFGFLTIGIGLFILKNFDQKHES